MQISFFSLLFLTQKAKVVSKKKTQMSVESMILSFEGPKKKHIKIYLFTPLSCSWQHTYQLVPIESHTLSAPPSLSNFWVYWPVSYAMCLICIWSTVTTVSSYFQKLSKKFHSRKWKNNHVQGTLGGCTITAIWIRTFYQLI